MSLTRKGVSNICANIIQIDELVCDNLYRKLWEGNKENLTRSIVKLVKLYLREYDTYKIATEQINLDSVT